MHHFMAGKILKRTKQSGILLNRKYSLFNVRPNFAFHYPQIIFRLKIQPKLNFNPEISFQPEYHVSSHAALAVYIPAYSIRRNRNVP